MKERNISPKINIDDVIDRLTWQIPLPQRIYEHLGWKETGYNNEIKMYARGLRYRFTTIYKDNLLFPNEVCYLTTFEGSVKVLK